MGPVAWQLASDIITIGLGWKESLTITEVSYLLIAVSLAWS